MATSFRDGVRLVKVGSWEDGPLLKGGPFAFTPDGTMLAVAESAGVVVLWSCADWREIARLEAPLADRVAGLAFTPDGSRLVFTVADTTPSLRAWDLRLIRQQLQALGLDWDWPGFPDAPTPAPLEVQVDVGNLSRYAEASRLYRRATNAWRRNGHAEAVGLLRQSARLNPEHATTHNALAWYLLTGPTPLRHDAEALRHAHRAVELRNSEPAHHVTLGVAQYRNGQYARAAGVLERSRGGGHGRQDGVALYFLAMSLARLGDAVKAQEWLERGVKWETGRMGLTSEDVAELKRFRAEAEQEVAARDRRKR